MGGLLCHSAFVPVVRLFVKLVQTNASVPMAVFITGPVKLCMNVVFVSNGNAVKLICSGQIMDLIVLSGFETGKCPNLVAILSGL